MVLVTPNELYCANAGDSRCVMSEYGNATELSKDHKPDLPEEFAGIEDFIGFFGIPLRDPFEGDKHCRK